MVVGTVCVTIGADSWAKALGCDVENALRGSKNKAKEKRKIKKKTDSSSKFSRFIRLMSYELVVSY